MSGLIYRDIITQIRRSFLGNIIPDILFFFMFLVLLGKYSFSPLTIVLLYLPTQTSIIPITLKESDSSYKGRMLSMTFPFSKRELVLSRYLSCCLYQLYGIGVMILFLALHFLIYGTYSPMVYLGIFAGGLLIALFMTLINVMVSFVGNINISTIFYIIFVLLAASAYILYLFLDIDPLDLLILPLPLLWGIAVGIVAVTGIISYSVSMKAFARSCHYGRKSRPSTIKIPLRHSLFRMWYSGVFMPGISL